MVRCCLLLRILQRISPTVEDLLSVDQSGFRRFCSTCDQVTALTTLKTDAVFLDLTAAYDTIWHTGLLYKLVHSDSRTAALNKNLRFRVHMGDDVSSWRRQANSLPQGSILAPTLFSLYTNDLPATRSQRFICANDIILLCPPRGNFLRDTHADSRSCPSCQILSAMASEIQHVQDCDKCFPPA